MPPPLQQCLNSIASSTLLRLSLVVELILQLQYVPALFELSGRSSRTYTNTTFRLLAVLSPLVHRMLLVHSQLPLHTLEELSLPEQVTLEAPFPLPQAMLEVPSRLAPASLE